MKKLSVKNLGSTSRFILPISPAKRVIKNSFSGFLVDDEEIKGCCCNCKEKYCLMYSSNEFHSDFFNSFPHNISNRICPTEAIIIDKDRIQIDSSKCIGCAICINRCPYSAIAYDMETGKCFVQTSEIRVPETALVQETQITDFFSLKTDVNFTNLNSPFISAVSLRKINNTDAAEIIVRNFLINIGIPTNVYAKGNQHNRIEFFAFFDEKYLIGECETANDSLSVTRRILDDLAVLISRYSLSIESIVPVAVLNRLPNKRTDFYEVIEDIKKVIGIQIYTVTYASLFLLNLFRCKLLPNDFCSFIINRNSMSIVKQLCKFIPDLDKRCKYLESDYFSVQK